ncbi:MAG: phosphate butyryltransferase [Syntrophobacterales bacterium]|jgi:phosphate butyryltransferase|nr:phosphate butyryltransferase [Syntrophobacterales bacterium]
MIDSFKDILAAAKQGGVKRVVVPFPGREDIEILSRAAALGLVSPILIGNEKSLRAFIGRTDLWSYPHEVLDEKDRKAALNRALTLMHEGKGDILMQGGLTQRALMGAVLDEESGMKKARVVSYASVFQLLKTEKLILVTDTFLNNNPGLVEKQAVLDNALQLERLLGVESPKVAVLAAIEQVNPGIPSTLDAAVLSKMAERRQFGKALVEGPLDIDCALSEAAAGRKGVQSVVTGNVDIYLVPEVDTGYLLAEALVFFGKMPAVGVVLGTTKPVVLTIPFISDENRVVEIALASLTCRKGVDNG